MERGKNGSLYVDRAIETDIANLSQTLPENILQINIARNERNSQNFEEQFVFRGNIDEEQNPTYNLAIQTRRPFSTQCQSTVHRLSFDGWPLQPLHRTHSDDVVDLNNIHVAQDLFKVL